MKTVLRNLILISALLLTHLHAFGQSVSNTASPGISLSDAQLDSMLAPVALYPDTLLTHILIATTYPLDVVAAHRWRQANQHLTPEQVEQALQNVSWDPSVKAITPFTDVLDTMASDLAWLGDMGSAVMTDQQRVLDRIQALRQQAWNHGSLSSNSYVSVQRDQNIIVIAPASPRVVYVPYYDTRNVYGHWRHRHQPVYWRAPPLNRVYAGFHWSTGLYLSAGFYFGDIFWHDRAVVIRTRPQHYPHNRRIKRVQSASYQRWQHHRPVRIHNEHRSHAKRNVPPVHSNSRQHSVTTQHRAPRLVTRGQTHSVVNDIKVKPHGNSNKPLKRAQVAHQHNIAPAAPVSQRQTVAPVKRHPSVTVGRTTSNTLRKHQKAAVKSVKRQSEARRAHH